MERLEVVKQIFEDVEENDIVITSAGYISREVYHYKDRPLNFYVMGSMGSALGIGIGVALKKDTNVYVIQGDGAFIMSLNTVVTEKQLELPNLFNCVLINGVHESTGGQELADNRFIDSIFYSETKAYYMNRDFSVPPRVPLRPTEIMLRFKSALKSIDDKK